MDDVSDTVEVAIGGGGCIPCVEASHDRADLSGHGVTRHLRLWLSMQHPSDVSQDARLEEHPCVGRSAVRAHPPAIRPHCHDEAQLTVTEAIGLSLYEELGLGTEEKLGKEVVRTQWLDFSTLGSRSLLGRRVLIVVRPAMAGASDRAGRGR